MKLAKLASFSLLVLAGAACGGEDAEAPTTPQIRDVALNFRAMIDGVDAACGQSYPDVGMTGTEYTLTDFRFYVHDVQLIDAAGAKVPLALTQDGKWQRDGLALLDFEDASATCENGTAETRDVVEGTAAIDEITGVEFVLGVPFEMNHQDSAAAEPPLNLSSMFWNWQGGYKFARIDGRSTGLSGMGFRFHLGSTGCEMDGTNTVTACSRPNRAAVRLDGFDPDAARVAVDFGALVATTDLDTNTASTAPGCMSAPNDPECAQIFGRLGLEFGGTAGGAQQLFSAE